MSRKPRVTITTHISNTALTCARAPRQRSCTIIQAPVHDGGRRSLRNDHRCRKGILKLSSAIPADDEAVDAERDVAAFCMHNRPSSSARSTVTVVEQPLISETLPCPVLAVLAPRQPHQKTSSRLQTLLNSMHASAPKLPSNSTTARAVDILLLPSPFTPETLPCPDLAKLRGSLTRKHPCPRFFSMPCMIQHTSSTAQAPEILV